MLLWGLLVVGGRPAADAIAAPLAVARTRAKAHAATAAAPGAAASAAPANAIPVVPADAAAGTATPQPQAAAPPSAAGPSAAPPSAAGPVDRSVAGSEGRTVARPPDGPDNGPAGGPELAPELWSPPAAHDPQVEPENGALADEPFGPQVVIEGIEVRGNAATRAELIRRTLPFAVGDHLLAGDPVLRRARFRVLALGYFRDVTMQLQRGTERGAVIVVVQVQERATVALNRLWFGSSSVTPWWAGADLTERNLFGTGVVLGGGLLVAQTASALADRHPWATEWRVGFPAILGSRWGGYASVSHVQSVEPYRISGLDTQSATGHFAVFPYRRTELRTWASYDVSALSRAYFGVSAEGITAQLPNAPSRQLADGSEQAIALHLQPGASRDWMVFAQIERDTRPDPVLPYNGYHLAAQVQLGAHAWGSDYQYAGVFARAEKWWPLRAARQAFAVRATGGAIWGAAPRFDRLAVADINRMAPPRAMGMMLSGNSAVPLWPSSSERPVYGDMGGTLAAEYSWRLFRRGSARVFGGDLFVGAGLWTLAERASLQTQPLRTALPLDMFVDVGLRLDTDVGAFEFTLANLLGRLPL